jgi:hypothetical protein
MNGVRYACLGAWSHLQLPLLFLGLKEIDLCVAASLHLESSTAIFSD